ncbi:MAG: pitrilysin family protein [Candidatus Theseobacter exili]|nr:pitrilysin family protein [Candidatus Theseobacter exili]
MKEMFKTFENGLRVIMDPMPHMNSLSIGVWVGIGGRHESEDISGISHFIEHMLFKGTTSRTSLEITQAIEGVGGSMNAFTSDEITCYYIKVPSSHMVLAVEILADMINRPLFKASDIDRERSIILEEYNMVMDNPSNCSEELLKSIMWPSHPLGRILTGKPETIESISKEQLLDYKSKGYIPNNIVLSIAGKFDPETFIKEAEIQFGSLKEGEKPESVSARNINRHNNVELLFRETEQLRIDLGLEAVSRGSDDRYPLKVFNVILGENMSSRLFQVVREEMGLAYEIHSNLDYYADTGLLNVSGGIELKRYTQAIEVVWGQILKLATEPVSKKELERSREYCLGQLFLAMESTSSRMIFNGENLLALNKVFSAEKIVEKIRAVTVEDVLQIASKLVEKNSPCLALVGPVKDGQAEIIKEVLN